MIVLSLGAGVQSSTMALMAAHGELPMPDCAIFADTQAEPKKIYDWLDWLEGKLPFPVHRVTKGNLREKALAMRNMSGQRFISIPFYTLHKGKTGQTRRQCTREFKVEPIEKKVRELIGLKPRQKGPKTPVVEQWIGISLDEVTRMKPSRKRYIEHKFPLIDKRMTRHDCLMWMERNGYPKPVKSSCTFCPYHSDAFWRDMQINDPDSFQDAVTVDEALRNGRNERFLKDLYLHASRKPLKDVDFRSLEDLGQINLFESECEGMCGV